MLIVNRPVLNDQEIAVLQLHLDLMIGLSETHVLTTCELTHKDNAVWACGTLQLKGLLEIKKSTCTPLRKMSRGAVRMISQITKKAIWVKDPQVHAVLTSSGIGEISLLIEDRRLRKPAVDIPTTM